MAFSPSYWAILVNNRTTLPMTKRWGERMHANCSGGMYKIYIYFFLRGGGGGGGVGKGCTSIYKSWDDG